MLFLCQTSPNPPTNAYSHRMYHCITKNADWTPDWKATTWVTKETSSMSYLMSETKDMIVYRWLSLQTDTTLLVDPILTLWISLDNSTGAKWSRCLWASKLSAPLAPCDLLESDSACMEYFSKRDVHICWLQPRQSAEKKMSHLLYLLFTFLWGTCKHIRREVSGSVSTCLVSSVSYSFVASLHKSVPKLFVDVCICLNLYHLGLLQITLRPASTPDLIQNVMNQ